MRMRNKEWSSARSNELVRTLQRDGIRVVQLGTAADVPLDGVVDLRGRTSLREAAAILAASDVFVGLAGALMHMARAVKCPSVIIYGGREDPRISGYQEFCNLVSRPACSPCWKRNSCEYDRQCLEDISVEKVVDAVGETLQEAPDLSQGLSVSL